MLPDVGRGLVARRITREGLLAVALIDAHVVDAHRRREAEVREQHLAPRAADPQVQHHAHGLLADVARAHVPVGPDGPPVQEERLLLADEPGDLALRRAGLVLKGVLLVREPVVPRVVEQRRGRDGLLEGPAAVRVHVRRVVVGDLEEGGVGPVPDVEGRDLEALRHDAEPVVGVDAGF